MTMLLFPNRRELPDNWLHVTRLQDGSLELRAQIWYEVGKDGDWGPGARMVADAPRRETITGITDGTALYRAAAGILGADRLSDRDIEPAVEVLSDLAPEMVEDFLTAHQDQRAGRQRQIDSSRAPERERREDSAGWLLMKWLERAKKARDHEGGASRWGRIGGASGGTDLEFGAVLGHLILRGHADVSLQAILRRARSA